MDIVLILLEAGLSDWVNMQDIMCNTALFKSTNEDMLQLLESYGADVNIRNRVIVSTPFENRIDNSYLAYYIQTGARARQNRLFSNNEKAMEVFIRFGLDISDLKSVS